MKVLYIMSSYNIYGGTPKKTLDLMKFFKEDSVLYVYNNSHTEFKPQFEATGGKVHEGFYGRNIYKHAQSLIDIVDRENIEIIQTQFSMGETLGFLVKQFNSKIKLVVAFVGAQKPSFIKSFFLSRVYKKIDFFIYISNYVKNEKEKQFPVLAKKDSKIIYNGTELRKDDGSNIITMKSISLLDIAGLTEIKNITVLIEALNILVNLKKTENIYLYVAGDGPQKNELKSLISKYHLENHIFLLGYKKNVGKLLNSCDIFVHPCYKEGFGIVVSEAMLAEKPIIVANAGALPELIEDEKTGLVVDAFNAEAWANAIIRVIEDKELASALASNARKKAELDFSVEKYVQNYKKLYQKLISA